MTLYETKDYIEQVMAHLNEQDSELLEMRYWHKMKYKEIAKEIGVSHTRVEQKLKCVSGGKNWIQLLANGKKNEGMDLLLRKKLNPLKLNIIPCIPEWKRYHR